jgi:hypothetical protein
LSPDNLAQRLELKLVKFQNVERLCIFVAGNQDECETSAISGAWPVEGTRRVGGAGRGRGGGVRTGLGLLVPMLKGVGQAQ